MDTFGTLGERATIDGIRRVARPPPAPGSLCDDASLISGTVACVDSVTLERHKPKGMSFERFGWTAAAVSLSDLAAMGATPTGILAAMLFPLDMLEKDILDIVSGMDQCAEFCDTHIYGGDTKPGHGSVSVTALGLMHGRKPMTRSGARPGDMVAVTGALGGPAAGYECLANGWAAEGGLAEAVESLYTPIPRVMEGILLSKSGAVTSCIDLSDGLGTAANVVCGASGVGMLIEASFLPMADGVEEASEMGGTAAVDLMTTFGGEYELMFTFPRDALENIHSLEMPFYIIGYVDGRDGVRMLEGGKERRLGYGRY